MKKVLSLICAAAVAASCAATAFAVDENATAGQIVNENAKEIVNEIGDKPLTQETYNKVVTTVLKDAVEGDNVHISSQAASLGARAIASAKNYGSGLTLQQSNVFKLNQAPAEAVVENAVADEAVVVEPEEEINKEEQTTVETPAEEETPAEGNAAVEEEPAAEEEATVEEEGTVEEAAVTEEAVPAEATVVENEAQTEETAVVEEETPAEEEAAVEEEIPAEEEPAVKEETPVEEAPVAEEEIPTVEEAPAQQIAEEETAQAVVLNDESSQPAAKEFGAIQLTTAADVNIDFSKVTGTITNDSKNVYTLTVNMPDGVDRDTAPAGYEVTVYGLGYYDYFMAYGTEDGAKLDNITKAEYNKENGTYDVTFWVPHFSTYKIIPAERITVPANTTSSGSSSSGSSTGYEAPDDSIYYTCPKCGYHNWTAAEGGYVCDHCGYMEVVKELAGWPNVNGVAVKASNAASLSAVYAGAIKATGASMSMLALAVVAMAAAAVGGAAYLVRKNGLGE